MTESLDDCRKTPLFALHQELGGRLVPFAGHALPVQFPAGIMAEHQWTRESAGLFDVSHMGQLLLTADDGPDAVAAALEALLPGDIKGLAPGRMRYSMLLQDTGGIIDDLMVTRREYAIYMVVNGATADGDIAHLRARLPAAIDLFHMNDQALLALQGPKAVLALSRVLPGVEALTFMKAQAHDWAGHPLWVSRSGYTGEDGFEISVPGDSAEAFARALLAEPEVRPIGLGARDSLRLEAGLPLYGHDISTATTPVEADLTFAISKRRKLEGGFPGAAHVLGQMLEGAPVRRVGLLLDGRQPAREGAEIFAGNARVGVVTSGGFAPTLQQPIAMGLVDIAHAADGAALEIDVRGRRLAARVTPMPFVPHRYVRSTQPGV